MRFNSIVKFFFFDSIRFVKWLYYNYDRKTERISAYFEEKIFNFIKILKLNAISIRYCICRCSQGSGSLDTDLFDYLFCFILREGCCNLILSFSDFIFHHINQVTLAIYTECSAIILSFKISKGVIDKKIKLKFC